MYVIQTVFDYDLYCREAGKAPTLDNVRARPGLYLSMAATHLYLLPVGRLCSLSLSCVVIMQLYLES